MSDPLDDLRAALGSVELSAGFEQRALRQIASEQSSRAGNRRWMMFLPVAAAVVIVATVFRNGGIEEPSGRREGAMKQSAVREPQAVAPPTPVAAVERDAPRRVRRAQASAVRFAIPESAHIDQAIAVRRLMLSATPGKVIGAPDSNQLSDDGSIRMPALIEIKPIVIAPLPTGQGGGSER